VLAEGAGCWRRVTAKARIASPAQGEQRTCRRQPPTDGAAHAGKGAEGIRKYARRLS